MAFRTEGDIVLASNSACDLTNLVVAYLEIYKKHSAGVTTAVRIPDQPYTVIFRPMEKEGVISFVIVCTKTMHWKKATYSDVDNDLFNESLGAPDTFGPVYRSETDIREHSFNIPIRCLLQPKEQMEESIRQFLREKKAEGLAAERRKQIEKLERELQQLKGESND